MRARGRRGPEHTGPGPRFRGTGVRRPVPARLLLDPDEVSYTGSQKVQLDPLREKVAARLARDRVEIAGYTYGD